MEGEGKGKGADEEIEELVDDGKEGLEGCWAGCVGGCPGRGGGVGLVGLPACIIGAARLKPLLRTCLYCGSRQNCC